MPDELEVMVEPTSPSSSAFSSSPIVTCAVSVSSSRQKVTLASVLTSYSAIMRGRAFISWIFWPLNSRIMSPAFKPAFSAGPPLVTLATRAPRGSSRPKLSAISSVTFWMRTPSHPRRVRPYLMICLITGSARAEGIAKPIPTEPPVGLKMAVLIPMTLPSILKSGPPEFPRLMDASVCR